jgi:hypothetical protein
MPLNTITKGCMQGFQYFSSVPELHYLQAVISYCIQWHVPATSIDLH